jgi:flagellar basal body rod protein FlgB
MMQTASIADNISDVLAKIIYFTQLRRQVLHDNLHKADNPGFMPEDMPVRELADALNVAVAEHLRNRRLLFRDTPNIKFGPNNTMQVQPILDAQARVLLQTNRDEYTEFQIRKLLENCLNRKVAEELLRQKGGAFTGLADWDFGKLPAGHDPLRDRPADRDATD